MAYPNYGNPWMVNPTWTNANTGNVGNQNNMSMNQNQLVYGNQQQNDGSLMTVFDEAKTDHERQTVSEWINRLRNSN